MRAFLDARAAGAPPLAWHTADYARDWIHPNDEVCPRLAQLEAAAFASDEFVARNASARTARLAAALAAATERANGGRAFSFDFGGVGLCASMDCAMTAACHGRGASLPDGVDARLLAELESLVAFREATKLLHDGAAYARLWSARLVAEIVGGARGDARAAASAAQLALWSAHDSTVMPLLAALLGADGWDGAWAPYASVVAFEFYGPPAGGALGDGAGAPPTAFRLVYQGAAITERVAGCEAARDGAPCAFAALEAATRWAFAPESCAARPPPPDASAPALGAARARAPTPAAAAIGSGALGAVAGALATLFVARRRTAPPPKRVQYGALEELHLREA